MSTKLRRGKQQENEVVIPRPSLFGSPLKDNLEVTCYFIQQCIDYLLETGLEETGLFRLCGSQTEIQQLKEMVLEDPLHFIFEGDVIHSVTGLLKMYFREMPDPIMRMELYDMWMTAASIPEEKDSEQQRKSTIASVLKLFTPENKFILGKLCTFLKKVTEHKAVNQMDARNLALCIGPNLLRSSRIDMAQIVQDSERISALVKTLIENAEFFFVDIESLNPFPKVFTIIFPNGERKIPIRSNSTLRPIVEKIAAVHHLDMNGYDLLDINGNIVELDTPFRKIRGLQVEILRKGSRVTVSWEHGTTRLAFPPGKSVHCVLDHLSMSHQIEPKEYRILDINGKAISLTTPIEDISGSTIQVRRSDEITTRPSKSFSTLRPSRRDLFASPVTQKPRQSHLLGAGSTSNLYSSATPTSTQSLPPILSLSGDKTTTTTKPLSPSMPSIPSINLERTGKSGNQTPEKPPELPEFQNKKSVRSLLLADDFYLIKQEESSWQSSLPLSPNRTSARVRIAERTDFSDKIEYRGFSGIHPLPGEDSNSVESKRRKPRSQPETPRQLETSRQLEAMTIDVPQRFNPLLNNLEQTEQSEKNENPEFRRSTVRSENMSKRPTDSIMFIGAQKVRSPRVSIIPENKNSGVIPPGKTSETDPKIGNPGMDSSKLFPPQIPEFNLEQLTQSMEHLEISRETSPPLEFHSNFFTIHLPYDGILESTELLQNMVEVICKARGAHVKDFEAEDRFGNLVGFETQLENVVGGEIFLKRKAV